MRNAYNILVGKHEAKRLRGRPGRRWEDNMRVDLREIGLEGVEWMHLVQDRDQWLALVNTVMNLVELIQEEDNTLGSGVHKLINSI
jgi:hypothetical protein